MHKNKVGSGSSNRKQVPASHAVPVVRPGRPSGSSDRKLIVSTAIETKKPASPAKEKSK